MKIPRPRIAIATLALCATACVSWAPADAPNPGSGSIPGGYSAASSADPGVVAAAAFALEAKIDLMRAAGEIEALELVGIRQAQRQVVAGANYRIEMTVKRGGREQTATAEVWWQAWRKPDPYRLTAWTWH